MAATSRPRLLDDGETASVREALKSDAALIELPSPSRGRARWQAFLHPVDPEKKALLRARWDSLPEELRTPNQLSGRHLTHCGFTTGASYCSFRCTHCYLPKNANEIPIPTLAEAKEQIAANRRFLGPGGGLQLTGGDVADAYFRSGRQGELIEIAQYAVKLGLVPMLMTHGQTLLENPDFLERLMVEGGLRQVAVHIDMTQAGRRNFPIQNVRREADLHAVRQAFTDLALRLRAKTGLSLELAHNCTVTERNLEFVPDVVRWFLADPQRSRIWRILSFQPEANTGRTIFSKHPATPSAVWEKICEGIGRPLDPTAFIGGHPDCNQGASLLVCQRTNDVLPLIPPDASSRALFAEILEKFGAISTVTTDGGTNASSFLPYRIAGSCARNPSLALRIFLRLVSLLLRRTFPFKFVRAVALGRAHTINIGTHNFMDAERVAEAPNDPVTRCRLEACVFKGAVKNRATKEWEAVPMCAMNQSRWSELYEERWRQDVTLTPGS